MILWYGCGSDDTTVTQEYTESEYYPLSVGSSMTYEVVEYVYGEGVDTLSYQLKEDVTGLTQDVLGHDIYIVDRFKKETGGTWSYSDRIQSYVENSQVIRAESNRKFVKLSLPLGEVGAWDGNALFDDTALREIGGQQIDYYKGWHSMIEGFLPTWDLEGRTYADVYRISIADLENKIELRQGLEYYAKGIGLVYREIQVLDTQCFDACDDLPWIEKAQKGHIYIQKILL